MPIVKAQYLYSGKGNNINDDSKSQAELTPWALRKGMYGTGPGRTVKMIRELTERMRTIEEKFGQLMKLYGITGRVRRGSGKPGEAIVKVAVEEGACMIVTGTRGHGKIKRALVGSVSDYVVHHSPIPVIICRGKPEH